MLLPTEILKEMIDKIIGIDRHNTVLFTFHLRNHQDPEFAIEDATVTSLTIEQNPMVNVLDNIILTCDVTPTAFQKLITKQSDLYADLVIEYANRFTNEPILEEPQIITRYNVLLHDLSSLAKKYNIQSLVKEQETETTKESQAVANVPISMQLITEDDHKANKSSFNGLVQDIKPDDMVKYISSVLKVPKVKMVEPDNKTSFQHFSIPPENSSFKSVFEYIQKKYGLYANGIRYYMSNGTLHIYPPFNMDSDVSPRLNIIKVSQDTYIGSYNYHNIEENEDISIISNTAIQIDNLSNVGSENDGNTKTFVRADGMIDGQVSKGKKMTLNNVTASVSSKNDSSITKGSAIPKYTKQTLNLYDQGSSFSEANTDLMTLGWTHARIGLLHPGMPVSFIFDDLNKVMVKKGIIEVITYNFTSVTRHLFICNAGLILRVDPKQEEYSV